MFEGVRKHWGVFREARKLDREEAKTRKPTHEKDFLPAALEILEKPASPAGRAIGLAILVFFGIAVGWSIIGRVDVVAMAPGRIIPTERVKVVQPAEIGVIRKIHVRDGQKVEAGDVLIELDPTFSGADQEQAREALSSARLAAARANALIAWVDGGSPDITAPQRARPTAIITQQRLVRSEISEYEAQVASLVQQAEESAADLAVVGEQITRLTATLPLLEEQVEARAELVELGLNSRLTFLELQERLVGHRQDILIQREQKKRVEASILTLTRRRELLAEEFRGAAIAILVEAEDEIALREQELAKADQRRAMQQLRAPVSGFVQQLAVHTIGGVVQPAEPLMVIVPTDGELVVEAMVLNKDIGFVSVGDAVEVKLEAFPFTKYGVIHGTLEDLSMDAIQDENMGLVYAARISLKSDTIMVQGKTVPLGPGMTATAEIKTGKRRLIEFLMSPLLRYKDEALRER